MSSSSAERNSWLDLFRQELAPSHGRMAGSLRTAFAATLATLLMLTLQTPVMAQGVFLLFLMSYETPYLTFKRSLAALALQCIGVATALCLIIATGNDPMARVLGVAGFTFVAAFVRRTQARFIQVADFAIFAMGTIYSFDILQSADQSVKLSVWPIATGAIAVGCKVAIEYVFTSRNPFHALHREIDARLMALEQLFLVYGSASEAEDITPRIAEVRRYAFLGQSKMLSLLQEVEERHKKDTSRGIDPTAIPVLARLLDLAAAFAVHNSPSELSAERKRLNHIARAIGAIREGKWDQAKLFSNNPSQYMTGELDRLEHSLRTLVFLYTEDDASEDAPTDAKPVNLSHARWLLRDSFTNMEYFVYAFKISLSATLCYVILNALAWPGISTAVTTVIVAGLSSSGATNQKLIFRFLGSALGGVVFGLGCIVFLFPHMDTATPFLIVIAVVSFLAAWVSRSAHFGYIGLQIALSFFYVAFEGFSASTQMAPARDRLMGILLALVVMLLVFRPEKGVDKMRQTFAHLLELQAEYLQATAFHVPASTRRLKAIELRERMERLVESARGFAEMMQYEFSRKRKQHVQISEEIERAISISGDLLLSINSWPHESNSEENNSLAQQSRTALKTGLHSLSEALIEKPGSVEETPVQPFHLPEAAPLHIANTLSIYNDLSQQCRQIALSYAE